MHPLSVRRKAINRINDGLMPFEAWSARFMALNNNTLVFTKENALENVVCTISAFWYRYHCARTIAPDSQSWFNVSSIILQQSSIGLDDGLAHAPIHTKTNDSLIYWRIYLSLGYDMLSNPLGITRCPKYTCCQVIKTFWHRSDFRITVPLWGGTRRPPADCPYKGTVIPSFDVFGVVSLDKLQKIDFVISRICILYVIHSCHYENIIIT